MIEGGRGENMSVGTEVWVGLPPESGAQVMVKD